jgi:hypothetical protein
LREKHSEEISEDISEMVMSILGTAVHNILETGAGKFDIAEERLYADINGTTISGQIDLRYPVEGGWAIADYKTCAAFSLKKNPEGREDWEKQLNVYRLLAELNGHTIKTIEIVAIIRDWTRASATRDPSYPQSAVVTIPVNMWDYHDTWRFVEGRISDHSSENLPECSDEEMWANPPTFAVYGFTKSGEKKKRATRVFDSLLDADIFGMEIGNGIVESRSGRRARCEGNYCGVADKCVQFAEYKAKQEAM